MSTELNEATTGDLRLPRFAKLSYTNLLIKRNFRSVVVCRSGRAGRLFSRKRVASCRSRLVVLRKYEAYNEAYWAGNAAQ